MPDDLAPSSSTAAPVRAVAVAVPTLVSPTGRPRVAPAAVPWYLLVTGAVAAGLTVAAHATGLWWLQALAAAAAAMTGAASPGLRRAP